MSSIQRRQNTLQFDSEVAKSENELNVNHLRFLRNEVLFSEANILNYVKYYGTVRHDANARHPNGLEIQNKGEKLNCFLDQNNRKKRFQRNCGTEMVGR